MSVYLDSFGLPILNGGNVSTSAACCCGCPPTPWYSSFCADMHVHGNLMFPYCNSDCTGTLYQSVPLDYSLSICDTGGGFAEGFFTDVTDICGGFSLHAFAELLCGGIGNCPEPDPLWQLDFELTGLFCTDIACIPCVIGCVGTYGSEVAIRQSNILCPDFSDVIINIPSQTGTFTGSFNTIQQDQGSTCAGTDEHDYGTITVDYSVVIVP